MKKIITTGLLLLTGAWLSPTSYGADGSVDSSFKVAFAAWWCQPWQVDGGNTMVAIQPDGKILMTGNASSASTPPHKNKWLVRLNPDGSLDAQFDNNLPASMAGSRGTGVALQDDGKIIFCTESDMQRLNPDGTLDPSYTPAVKTSIFGGIRLQADQKLLISRTASPYLVRLNTDGTQDNSFAPTFNGAVREALPLSTGKILVGGNFTQCNGVSTGKVVLLNSDGTLDASFDISGGGLTATAVMTLTEESPTSYLIGGYGYTQYNGATLNNKAVIRLSDKGALDAGFDNATAGPTGFWSNSSVIPGSGISAMIALPDGKIILTGNFLNYATVTHAYGIVKLNHDGTVDPSFISTGFATDADPNGTGTNTHRPPTSARYESDSSIIVTGTFSGYNGSKAYCVVRIKNTVTVSPTNTISIAKLDPTPNLCLNTPVEVVYSATGTYNPGNIFTVQLSDENGDFSNAVAIGSRAATANGTINAQIPNNAVVGTKYRIRVVSSDPVMTGSDNGADLSVNPQPVVTATVTPATAQVCAGAEATLDYIAGAPVNPVTYSWNKGVVNKTAFKPTQTEFYTITATDNVTGCTKKDSISITVLPAPTVTATAQPNKVCAGENVTLTGSGNATSYSWDNGVTNGVAFAPTTTRTYTLTGTAANNCTAASSVTVTVNPLPAVTANANPGADICEGNEVTLTGGGAATYSWDKNVTDGIALTPAQTETYTVTGRDTNGCENSAQITVNVRDTAVTNIAENICQGTDYILGTQVLNNTGIYTEVFTAANGCDSTVTLDLTVTQVDVSIIQKGNELKAAVGAASYQWLYCNNNQPIPGATGQTFSSTLLGDFSVVVTMNGCADTSSCYHLEGDPIGIRDIDFSSRVTLYPNPNNGQMIISSGYEWNNATVRIINIVGHTVLEQSHISGNSIKLDISRYAAGVYYAELRSGAHIARIKFSKE